MVMRCQAVFVVFLSQCLQRFARAIDTCPGSFNLAGHGEVQLVPTGWGAKVQPAVDILPGGRVVPHLNSRSYFADKCTAGTYDNDQYLALNLLGKTFSYTTDLSNSGCGCNAALYLVSLRQSETPGECKDHYCDANNVCGQSCAEIDIQEANEYAWHSTLHTSSDNGGQAVGYGGGGKGYSGPRDFGHAQYAPNGLCVDTSRPFQVNVSFPTDSQGKLTAMEITLTQTGKSCSVSMNNRKYLGNDELTSALSAGMTPVISYWNSNTMTWMDGAGADGHGPCQRDHAASCSDTVKFYDFSITSLHSSAQTGSPNTAEVLDGPISYRPPEQQEQAQEQEPQTGVQMDDAQKQEELLNDILHSDFEGEEGSVAGSAGGDGTESLFLRKWSDTRRRIHIHFGSARSIAYVVPLIGLVMVSTLMLIVSAFVRSVRRRESSTVARALGSLVVYDDLSHAREAAVPLSENTEVPAEEP